MNRLPILGTVFSSIKFTFKNSLNLLRAMFVWIAIMAILVWVSTYDKEQGNGFAFILAMIVAFVAIFSFAVVWHRLVVRGETPPFFKFDFSMVQYFGYWLLLGVFYKIAETGLSLLFVALYEKINMMIVTIVAIMLFVLILSFLTRMALVYPGVSVKDQRMGVGFALTITKGNGIRIFIGSLLCYVPAFIVAILVLQYDVFLKDQGLLTTLIVVLTIILTFTFYLTYLSKCYEFFIKNEDERPIRVDRMQEKGMDAKLGLE